MSKQTIKNITKGTVIVAADGKEFTVLSRKATSTGTCNAAGEANYVTMVRPTVGRGFDLILSQTSLDNGSYTLKVK